MLITNTPLLAKSLLALVVREICINLKMAFKKKEHQETFIIKMISIFTIDLLKKKKTRLTFGSTPIL